MLLSVISNLPVNKFNSLKYKVAVPSPSIKDSDIEDYLKIFQNRQTQYLFYLILIADPLYLQILYRYFYYQKYFLKFY